MKHPFLPLAVFLCLSAAGQTPKPVPPAAKPKPAAARPKPPAAKPRPAAAKAKPAEPAVITVGKTRITKARFDSYLAALPDRMRAQFQTPDARRRFANDLSEMIAMAEEARRQGLDQKNEIKARIEFSTWQALANALTESIPLGETALREYYDAHKDQYTQVSGRHILVRFKGSRVPIRSGQQDLSEEEALARTQELRKRITGGEDFGAVARSDSDDTGSGAQGGALGMFTRGRMVPEFEKAAFSLPVGEVSEPVRTQFGYHLIQIQEQKQQDFDEVKAAIEQRLRPEHDEKLREKIRSQTNVEIDEGFFQ
jgi:hypothetical protein